jgi:hypothetical protein
MRRVHVFDAEKSVVLPWLERFRSVSLDASIPTEDFPGRCARSK